MKFNAYPNCPTGARLLYLTAQQHIFHGKTNFVEAEENELQGSPL